MFFGTLIGLMYYALGAVVLYFIIRLAVKHGIQDAEKLNKSKPPV